MNNDQKSPKKKQVRLYKVDADQLNVQQGMKLLSRDVQAKIGAKRRLQDSQTALVSQLLQRYALIDAIGGDIDDVIIDYSSNGKPYYSEYPDINYSVSHSENLVILALIHSRSPIGVDVMKYNMSSVGDPEYYAEVFTDKEIYQMRKDKSDRTFLKLWALKEAYVKATGEGITDDIKDIEIAENDGNNFGFLVGNKISPYTGQLYCLDEAVVGIVAIDEFMVDLKDFTAELQQFVQKASNK